MDNHFLAHDFNWDRTPRSGWMHFCNRVLRRLNTGIQLGRRMDGHSEMTNLEQRLNLWHLCEQVLALNVPGDFAEFGSFDGKTATILGRALQAHQSIHKSRARLHVYDHFQIGFHLQGRDIRKALEDNFHAVHCPLPQIHDGDFATTIPAELPTQLAFVHIDCGYGGEAAEHAATVTRLLEAIYPRMPAGAVCVLMDYWDGSVCNGPNWNPGAGQAATAFLASRPEQMVSLYAGEYCHGYFRKSLKPVDATTPAEP